MSIKLLNQRVVNCRLCPRLVHFRETLPKRASYRNEPYYRRPVIGFGDPQATLLIVGLAPSAHGGNRTGRIFTGDESARFLFKCLHKVGLATQPTSESLDDGLILKGCYLTAIVRCVPPSNRPTSEERCNCLPYWTEELNLLPKVTTLLALGEMAFTAIVAYARSLGGDVNGLKFYHDATYKIKNLFTLKASYHPSPQNTYTKKLTESNFCKIFNDIIF